MLTRRDFFRGGWLTEESARQKAEEEKTGAYFASFESCYALLAEIPLAELLETARARGVTTENRSKLDIVRELYSLPGEGGRAI